MNPNYNHRPSAYDAQFQENFLPPENVELFDLACPDDQLQKMLVNEFESDESYWQQNPWNLKNVDRDNVRFLLGDQVDGREFLKGSSKYVDNRLFTSTRAILSYATGQLAIPSLTPSKGDDEAVKQARAMQQAVYQHSLNEQADAKFRAAVLNLVVRKRAYLKVRFDKDCNIKGDLVTEVVDPSDIIVDRFAKYMENPNKIYQRVRCTVDELCQKFPKKEKDIKDFYSIKQGRYSQMSQFVTYIECWFSYNDGAPREGVCWFIPDGFVLDKMPNPNWIYTGNDEKDKKTNLAYRPPKPYIPFNYINLGLSYIDETSLFEQAKQQQDILNRKGKQFMENTDFMNGRWVVSKGAMNQEDAAKFVNRGAKTIAMVDAPDVGKAVQVLTPNQLPPQVYESMIDTRNEIDTMMGTPNIFRGSSPDKSGTLGRDMLVKQQAGSLQDDLVRCVQTAAEQYYMLKLQMMRAYYVDDYWFGTKGGDGKFQFVLLSSDLVDPNVKVGVQVDSTLPLDKERIRSTALELAKSGRIDNLTLFEDLGLPNPEVRAERLSRSMLDPMGYMEAIETSLDNGDAEQDIRMIANGKVPIERDNYDQTYLDYWNNFMTTNRFAQLPQEIKQKLVGFLMVVQHQVTQMANLQGMMLDDAGMPEAPIPPPAPKKTIQIQARGNLDPNQTAEAAGVTPTAPGAPPAPGMPPASLPNPTQQIQVPQELKQ